MHIHSPIYLLSGKLSRFGVLLCSSASRSRIDAFFKFDIYCYGIKEASSKNHTTMMGVWMQRLFSNDSGLIN